MPTRIDRDEVQRLLAEGPQLVEVLPSAEFDQVYAIWESREAFERFMGRSSARHLRRSWAGRRLKAERSTSRSTCSSSRAERQR
jgi:hypothetical protein